MAYVYILKSLKDKKYYIGATNNLERRLNEHNSGKTKSLRFRKPLTLIYKEICSDIKEARYKEKLYKSYKSGNAFKKLIGFYHNERE